MKINSSIPLKHPGSCGEAIGEGGVKPGLPLTLWYTRRAKRAVNITNIHKCKYCYPQIEGYGIIFATIKLFFPLRWLMSDFGKKALIGSSTLSTLIWKRSCNRLGYQARS